MDDLIYSRLNKLEQFVLEQTDFTKIIMNRISEIDHKLLALKDVQQKFAVLEDRLDKISSDKDKSEMSIKELESRVQEKLDHSFQLISKNNLKSQEIEASINSLGEYLNQLQEQMKHFFLVVDRICVLEKLSSESQKTLDVKLFDIEKKIAGNLTGCEKLISDIDLLKEKMKFKDHYDATTNSLLQDAHKSISALDSKICKSSQDIRSEIKETVDETKSYVDNVVKTIPNPVKPEEILQSVHSFIKEKFDLMERDVRNVMIQCQAIDKTQILMSRTVENLQSRMKNLEVAE